jgi:hypothetical protein
MGFYQNFVWILCGIAPQILPELFQKAPSSFPESANHSTNPEDPDEDASIVETCRVERVTFCVDGVPPLLYIVQEPAGLIR